MNETPGNTPPNSRPSTPSSDDSSNSSTTSLLGTLMGFFNSRGTTPTEGDTTKIPQLTSEPKNDPLRDRTIAQQIWEKIGKPFKNNFSQLLVLKESPSEGSPLSCKPSNLNLSEDMPQLEYTDLDNIDNFSLVTLKEVNDSEIQAFNDNIMMFSEEAFNGEASKKDAAIQQLDTLFETHPPEWWAAFIQNQQSQEAEQQPNSRLEANNNLIARLPNLYSKIRTYNPESPILNHLVTLRDSLYKQNVKLILGSIEGTHSISEGHDYWKKCNDRITPLPTNLNSKGLSKQFDTDLLRSSNFTISSNTGDLVFSSTKTREDTKDNDPAYQQQCTESLQTLCQGERQALLGMVSEMASQTPHNFLFYTFSQLLMEKYGSGYTIAIPDRVIETQFEAIEKTGIKVIFLIAFQNHNFMLPDVDRKFKVTQPTIITCALSLNAENLDSHKLDPIKLQIPSPSAITIEAG